MKLVFANADYWTALLNPCDRLHFKAQAISESLAPVYIVTSEAILIKLFSDFSQKGESFQRAASALSETLFNHPNTSVVSQTSPQFQQGISLHRQRLNQAWSLTDCVSFKIMETQGITEALTSSCYFEQAGFVALLREQLEDASDAI
ncbi:MAG: type II toxin-antitoxin system VapC family toxin [Cyanophyceae cyanobacterium]